MTISSTLQTAHVLFRRIIEDRATARLFLILMAFDLAFIGLIGAKALSLIQFSSGLGSLIIATQLSLATLVLAVGWWLRRLPALGSLALAAIALVALKVFHIHNMIPSHVATVLDARGLEHVASVLVGLLLFAVPFTAVLLSVLSFGWLMSDRGGRAAILIVGGGLAATALTALAADVANSALQLLTSVSRFSLSRAEQGLEIIAVSALLALVVGVVRLDWTRAEPSGSRSERDRTLSS
jgi:hypothetical protein